VAVDLLIYYSDTCCAKSCCELGVAVERKSKIPWGAISGIVAIILGVIGIFTGVSSDRTATLLAIALILLTVGFSCVVWMLMAKNESGSLRFSNGRWVAIAAAVLVSVTGAAVMWMPSSRKVVMHDVFGLPSLGADVKVARVLVRDSETNYRIAITLTSDLPYPELTKTVEMRIRCAGMGGLFEKVDRLRAAAISYQIQQHLKVTTRAGTQVSGEVTRSDEKEYEAPVKINMVDISSCGQLLNLSFDLSTTLPPKDSTIITVDLPKKFIVSLPGATDHAGLESEAPINRPDRENFTAIVRVGDVAFSGSPES
jgi:uncharacterized membrane protein HdeD (DUF308 family)